MATWAKGLDFKNSGNTARIGGVGIYGTDTTSEKIYIGFGAEPWNNSGLQVTKSGINYKGNKIYHAGDKPTASEIGAAASSHTHNYMPHTKYTTTQDANNIKTTGVYSFNTTCTNAATSNHGTLIAEFNVGTPYQLWMPDNANIIYKRNYTKSSNTWGSWNNTLTNNISGNASTATTLQTARTLTIGNTGKSFNGSGNVSWSLSEIGAAASSHTHSYIPLSGSTGITGVLRSNSEIQTTSQNAFRAVSGNYGFFIRNDGSNTYFLLTNSGDQYGNWNSLRPIMINNSTGLVTLGNGASGNLTGNATTATTLQNARTLTIGKTGKSFNGAANVSWSTDEIGALDKNNDSTLASGKKILLGYSSSWLNGDSSNGAVTLRAGGNLFIHGDADSSSSSEYVSIKAGNNDLRVISSAASTGQDKLTFNGNIVYHAGRKPTVSEIGAAASNHTHNSLTTKGTNTINSTTNDTTSNWGAHGNSVHWYTTNGCLNNQPSQYGYILNIGSGSEVHQLWMTQSSGNLAHRGGNASGWNGSWRTILDSSNFTSYAASANHSHSNYAASSHTHNMISMKSGHASDWTSSSAMNGKTYMGGWHGNLTSGTAGYISLGANGSSTLDLIIDGEVYVKENQKVYHPGNKPTAADIGAAAANHTHSYLPLSGGTLTGLLSTPNNQMGIKLGDDALIGDGNIANNMVLQGCQDSNSGGITFGSGKDTNIYRGGTNLLKTDDTMNAVGGFQWNGQSLDERYFARRGEIGKTTNWNSIVHPGCYKVQQDSWGNAESTHAPCQGYSYGLLMVYRTNVSNEDRLYQVYMPHRADEPRWYRMCNNGSWQEWKAQDVRDSADRRYVKGDNIKLNVTGDILNSSMLNTSRKQLIAGSQNTIYVGNTTANMNIEVASTPNINLGGHLYPVYHAGNKPTAADIGAAASNHSHNLVNLGSEAFGSGNDLNTYNTNRTWVCRTGNSSANRPADYYTVLNVGAEHNSNFQLAHHYGSASAFFVRGRHDTTGGYTPWAKVYTDKNKPTPADIGAAASSHTHSYLPLSGGTVNGTITTTNLDVAKIASFGGQIKIVNTSSPNTLSLQGATNANQAIIKFGNGARIYSGAGEARLMVEGGIYSNKIIEGADIMCNGSMYPTRSAQGGWDIGIVTNRFYTLYAVNTNLSSDKNMKEDIVYLDDEPKTISLDEETSFKTPFKDFICNDLKVAAYKYKRQTIEEDEDGNERIKDLPHQPEDSQIGFIAQDIRNTEVGSMFVYGEDGNMNYSPSGFTTVVAKALQEEIKYRDQEIAQLKEELSLIKEKLGIV